MCVGGEKWVKVRTKEGLGTRIAGAVQLTKTYTV